ncbi:MAG: flagellar hook capping FlgD N-terminal domain-containing protein, partial [bacterium]
METQTVGSALASTTDTGQVSSDFLGKEEFFELLITQLKYQNPLEPLQDQEFIAQMTQFSSLEQLQNLNDVMSQSVNWDMVMSQTISNTMATSLIGKNVVASGSTLALGQDGDSKIVFQTGAFVHDGQINIYSGDSLVRTISVENLPAGAQSIEWDGKDGIGNELPAGSYTFELELYDLNGDAVTSESFIQGKVSGVSYVEG